MNTVTKQIDNPLETLIARAIEQREVCLELKMYETARTFNDLAKYLVGLSFATQL